MAEGPAAFVPAFLRHISQEEDAPVWLHPRRAAGPEQDKLPIGPTAAPWVHRRAVAKERRLMQDSVTMYLVCASD